MKIDLIRYWKDREYAKDIGSATQIEANPAGELLTNEFAAMVGGGTESTTNPTCSPTGCEPATEVCGLCGTDNCPPNCPTDIL